MYAFSSCHPWQAASKDKDSGSANVSIAMSIAKYTIWVDFSASNASLASISATEASAHLKLSVAEDNRASTVSASFYPTTASLAMLTLVSAPNVPTKTSRSSTASVCPSKSVSLAFT